MDVLFSIDDMFMSLAQPLPYLQLSFQLIEDMCQQLPFVQTKVLFVGFQIWRLGGALKSLPLLYAEGIKRLYDESRSSAILDLCKWGGEFTEFTEDQSFLKFRNTQNYLIENSFLGLKPARIRIFEGGIWEWKFLTHFPNDFRHTEIWEPQLQPYWSSCNAKIWE